MKHTRWTVILASLLVVVGLPLAGAWFRRLPEGRCALDGMVIQPLYRVRLMEMDGKSHPFCCVRCAEIWARQHSDAQPIAYVTDEESGQEIPFDRAFFVRSLVVTTPTTGNRIHAFGRREDAERHAAAAGGKLLDENERPLASPH